MTPDLQQEQARRVRVSYKTATTAAAAAAAGAAAAGEDIHMGEVYAIARHQGWAAFRGSDTSKGT